MLITIGAGRIANAPRQKRHHDLPGIRFLAFWLWTTNHGINVQNYIYFLIMGSTIYF